MKAVLDHIGIAVADLPQALAFYRDALGLHVEVPEEVVAQRVRAHFIPVGEASLELLEATASDSPIARYLDKRGPGLHHVTLRVADLAAVLQSLAARGVRLIDAVPRAGAEGALVAFIHPAAAHGVLVELKQAAAVVAPGLPPLRPTRLVLGGMELYALHDGYLRLDGGSMFGVVPKALWEKKAPADERNRIALAMRPLLIRGDKTVLIDAGLGDKETAKFCDLYGVDRRAHLDHALAAIGLSADDIDIVIASHLHFDHAGGFTAKQASGRLVPRFPRARYVVRRGEWEDATHPHERNRGSYLPDNFLPLLDAGVLDLIDADAEVVPGVRVQRTGGHTAHHQIVWLESAGQSAVFAADLLPTAAHLPEAWVMGFDLYPVDTLFAKKALLRDVLAREALILFEHDPAVASGRLVEHEGRRAWHFPS